VWNSTEIATALKKDYLVQKMQAERDQTMILASIGKKDRETAFEQAVNSADPMWDPIIPTCEVV
jgi:hypothetical protein